MPILKTYTNRVMKSQNKSLFSIFSIVVSIASLLFWSVMYYRSWNISFLYLWLWILSIVLWLVILNEKERFFLDVPNFKFLNNDDARKKAYKIWAVLWFFVWILFITNIFVSFYSLGMIPIALILTCLITLIYMFKYKK